MTSPTHRKTRPSRQPSQPQPWEQPGHRFSIDWPPGFVSRIDVPVVSDEARRMAATKARMQMREAGREIDIPIFRKGPRS